MPVVDPANNPPVMVTPLIVDPRGNGRAVTYTISACPNDPFAPAPPGGGQGGGAFPSGGARTTVGSALCDENSPTTWLLTPSPVAAGDSLPGAADRRRADGRVHEGHLPRPVRQPARRVRSGDAADPGHQGRRRGRRDPRREAGAVLGAAHRRHADAQPEPDHRRGRPVLRARRRDVRSRRRPAADPARPRRRLRLRREAGRDVDLDPAGEGERRVVRDDGDRSRHAPGRPVHGPARDAALPVLRDGGDVLAAHDVQRARDRVRRDGPDPHRIGVPPAGRRASWRSIRPATPSSRSGSWCATTAAANPGSSATCA